MQYMKHYIDKLTAFVDNGGLLTVGNPPSQGEPFYEDYMAEKIRRKELNLGDRIRIIKQKDRKTKIFEGILVSDASTGTRLSILTKGKKLWANRANEKGIDYRDVISVEKVKDAYAGFNIKSAYPFYRSSEERQKALREYDKKIKKYHKEDVNRFANAYPDRSLLDTKVLSLNFNLLWDYAEGNIESAKIVISLGDGCSACVPATKIKQIFPNKTWYTVCGTEKGSESVIIPFDSMDKLLKIKYISCLWTIGIGKKKHHILSMVYPSFYNSDKPYNIYNVGMRISTLHNYADNLCKRSVLQHSIITDFDQVGVIPPGADHYVIIKGDMPDILDMQMAMHDNSLQKVADNIAKKNSDGIHPADVVEVFCAKDTVNNMHYFSPHANYENMKRRREQIDFSEFFS